jgi:hypothetical protein
MLRDQLSIRLLRTKQNFGARKVILIPTPKSCSNFALKVLKLANLTGNLLNSEVISPNTEISSIERKQQQRGNVACRTGNIVHQQRYRNCLSLGYKFAAQSVLNAKGLNTSKSMYSQNFQPHFLGSMFYSMVSDYFLNFGILDVTLFKKVRI